MSNDVAAINDLAARFSDAVSRRASSELAELFVADGTWIVPGLADAQGHAAITSRLDGLLGNFAHLVQVTYLGVVTVTGDTATARHYINEFGSPDGTGGVEFLGVYDSALARTDEGWRFQTRQFTFLQRSRTDNGGKYHTHPHLITK
ncbi:MAG: nuclear transport factor 2 family protein [Nostocoides sp.]